MIQQFKGPNVDNLDSYRIHGFLLTIKGKEKYTPELHHLMGYIGLSSILHYRCGPMTCDN